MKLTAIMDNHRSEQKALTAEHGLSFLLDTGTTKILFDFGAGRAAYDNAVKLNVDLKSIDYAVGSHGHYDHGGGYPYFFVGGLSCPLITGDGYFEEKYAFDGMKATYLGCGFDERWMEERRIDHRVCREMMKLEDDCYVVGGFQRAHDFETIPKRFVLRDQEGWKQDDFSDEVCLVLTRPEGLVVIVGCSHPGILNILKSVQMRFHRPVYAVFGGTHLVEADRPRIEKTLDEMKAMGVRLIGFNHCSGELLQEMLDARPDIRHCYLGAGDCLFL